MHPGTIDTPWERVRPNGLVEAMPWSTKLIGERQAVARGGASWRPVRPNGPRGALVHPRSAARASWKHVRPNGMVERCLGQQNLSGTHDPRPGRHLKQNG